MQDTPIPGYRYLVTNRECLGGKPTIRELRASRQSFILACLAEGMSYQDIVREYSDFPRDQSRRGAALRRASSTDREQCGCLTLNSRHRLTDSLIGYGISAETAAARGGRG